MKVNTKRNSLLLFLTPTVAALLLSLESVVATIAGMIAYAAVILVQLPKEWFEKKKRA